MRPTLQGQRIGARITVNVNAQFQPIRRTKSLFRREPRPMPATVKDLSVSGAKVQSGRSSLEVRDRARLITGDGTALVIVRRIEPVDRDVCHYGVEFVEIEPQLAVYVNQLCVGARATEIDWRWNIAH
jgi:hypothetical protein